MFGWFERKTPHRRSRTVVPAEPVESDNSTTSIDKLDFAMELPFSWSEVVRDAGFEFQNKVLPEQLIVDVQHTRQPIGFDEMRPAVEKLVEIRRNACEQLSNGRAQLTATDIRKGESQIEARFQGRDEANEVQLATAIRATPTKIVTMSLYRYTLSEVDAPFADYASIIFDLARVKNT